MFTSSIVVLALSASAFANVFITSPVGTTTFTGGQQASVTWQDDGSAPSLASFGPASIAIYTGNSQQQTLLQEIAPSVDVSTTASVVFTPNPTIGPNGDEYFIRVQSLGLKDATNPQYPALAFSAKFTMAGMTGTFNATVQAQIDGQSTAPIGGTAAASAPATSAPAVSTTIKKVTSTSAASTAKSTSTATSSNAASKLAGAGLAGVAGVVAALLSLF
jgi:hypothetical protein